MKYSKGQKVVVVRSSKKAPEPLEESMTPVEIGEVVEVRRSIYQWDYSVYFKKHGKEFETKFVEDELAYCQHETYLYNDEKEEFLSIL